MPVLYLPTTTITAKFLQLNDLIIEIASSHSINSKSILVILLLVYGSMAINYTALEFCISNLI